MGNHNQNKKTDRTIAILVSGGLDSAILLTELIESHENVYPLFVRMGLFWENVELTYLCRFLKSLRSPSLQPLHVLEMPIVDTYIRHWSVNGRDAPGIDTPDEAVFLPGRNVFLLSKAMLWCHLRGIPDLALGSLSNNPFPDATPDFFNHFTSALNQGIAGRVKVLRPYAGLHKCDVMHRGRALPLQLTFSCIQPVVDKHCGTCNKCGERRQAFIAAEMVDPTEYHTTVSFYRKRSLRR